MHVKILILYQNFKALKKIILFLLNFEVPLNVAFLKATPFVGTNFKDWKVQIEFDLSIMDMDLAIYDLRLLRIKEQRRKALPWHMEEI